MAPIYFSDQGIVLKLGRGEPFRTIAVPKPPEIAPSNNATPTHSFEGLSHTRRIPEERVARLRAAIQKITVHELVKKPPYEVPSDLLATLFDLTPTVVHDEWGDDLLTWYALTNHFPAGRTKAAKHLAAVRGIPATWTTVYHSDYVKGASWDFETHQRAFSMATNNGSLLDMTVDRDVLPRMFSYATHEEAIARQRFALTTHLGLMLPHTDQQFMLWNYTESSDIHHDIHCEGQFAITLVAKGLPQALVAFDVTDANTLHIRQIQGIQGIKKTANGYKRVSNRALFRINWRKLLVDAVEIVARRLGFTRLTLLPAAQNEWATDDESDKSLRARFEKTYDQVALECGYAYDNNAKIYVKTVNNSES